MVKYLNKKYIFFFLWFLFSYQSCTFPVESEKKPLNNPVYRLSTVPCVPAYLNGDTRDSVLFALINDSQYINKKITNGYMIEISEEENYTKEVRFGDSKMKLSNNLYLLEGFYKNKLKTGLWKKYYRLDMNCWILRENFLY